MDGLGRRFTGGRRKKKRRGAVAVAAVAVAAAVAASVVGYSYYIDYLRAKGAAFSAEIESIQDDLAAMQEAFEAVAAGFEAGEIAEEELEARAEAHFESLDSLLKRYDALDPPAPFAASVDLFRLSAESQLERDREEVRWLLTGDAAHDERAGRLHQDAFAYELSALAEFKEAQSGGGGGGGGQDPAP